MAGTRTIPLTKDKLAIVDEEDYDALTAMGVWYLSDTGYAVRRTLVDGVKKTIRMHRVVCGTPDGLVTDHLNGNTLDNRKSNLRSVSQKVNSQNRHNTRGYCWDKEKRMWVVRYKSKFYGRYHTKMQAEIAYTLACSGVNHPNRLNPRRKYLPKGVYYMQPMAQKGLNPYYIRPTKNGVRKFKGYFGTISSALNALDKVNKERGIAS